jgi:hypothetical protein
VLTRPVPATYVVVEDLDDDVCLYRSDLDEVLVLNASAGDVWRLADGTLTVADITARLAASYSSDPVALRVDVDLVVSDLAERGYLVESTVSAATPGPS